ncbi:hypothetical protein ACH5RR_003426 [Cinchona calisaya]|uniref:Uncharacterized protein n=1 Tax=Cinchona calisaya TaxID=153742 RepID=A0ABD3AUY6_9GENT
MYVMQETRCFHSHVNNVTKEVVKKHDRGLDDILELISTLNELNQTIACFRQAIDERNRRYDRHVDYFDMEFKRLNLTMYSMKLLTAVMPQDGVD